MYFILLFVSAYQFVQASVLTHVRVWPCLSHAFYMCTCVSHFSKCVIHNSYAYETVCKCIHKCICIKTGGYIHVDSV